jgi:hypothetical protein
MTSPRPPKEPDDDWPIQPDTPKRPYKPDEQEVTDEPRPPMPWDDC